MNAWRLFVTFLKTKTRVAHFALQLSQLKQTDNLLCLFCNFVSKVNTEIRIYKV